MKKSIKELTEMSPPERMIFVKECCKENESVTKSISLYVGCVLDWAKESNDFMIFTVNAGKYDGKYVRDANEYITVSINTKTEKTYCLTNYLHNYSGYRIFIAKELDCIKQEIGYGFGSWSYKVLNLDLTEKSSNSKQEYGSCCG